MKIIIPIVLVFLSSIRIFPAYAGNLGKKSTERLDSLKWEYSIFIGRSKMYIGNFELGSKSTVSGFGSIRLARELTECIDIYGQFTIGQINFDPNREIRPMPYQTFMFGLQLSLPLPKFQPFIQGGFGLGFYSPTNISSSKPQVVLDLPAQKNSIYGFGLGLKTFTKNHFGFVVSMEYNFMNYYLPTWDKDGSNQIGGLNFSLGFCRRI